VSSAYIRGQGRASSIVPPGTKLGILLRSSNNSSSLGSWSDTLFQPDTSLSGILEDSTRFLQYQICFKTSDSTFSASLLDIAFSWTLQVGVEEGHTDAINGLSMRFAENPAYQTLSVIVTLPSTLSLLYCRV